MVNPAPQSRKYQRLLAIGNHPSTTQNSHVIAQAQYPRRPHVARPRLVSRKHFLLFSVFRIIYLFLSFLEVTVFTSSLLILFKQPEFAHPFEILGSHCDITVASHNGGEAPLDSSSITAFKDDDVSTRFLKEQERLWKNTRRLGDLVGKTDQFDAIFYVGGYGRKLSRSFPHFPFFSIFRGATVLEEKIKQDG